MRLALPALLSRRPPSDDGDSVHPNNPPRLLIEGFIVLIILGTCLLKLPAATHAPVTWLEAAFTATSAVTVTGLVVVDTGSQFTLFGQLVILVLIQLGGLGLMTFAVLTAAALGFSLGISEQRVVREGRNQVTFQLSGGTTKKVVLFAFSVEAVGLVLLACFFVPELGWRDGLYHGLFYTVSGFNNAGFALSADSLRDYVSHAGISLTVSALFIIGGLGFIVVRELAEKRRFSTLSVYSKIILTATLVLNVLATVVILGLEYGNPQTLGQLESLGDKVMAAWFQGVTPRTAGFNTLHVGSLTTATSVFLLLLMFIGGAPNSTTSGIKLSTFVILLSSTRAFLRGDYYATVFRRSLTSETVTQALAITTIAMATIFIGVLILSITARTPFLDLVFEVVSAFGTVGLSRGATGELGAVGQITLMVIMLIGRVGPLTLGYVLTRRQKTPIRYATTEFPVG